MTYVELHCHSAYSFADGASLPEELAARAEELGCRSLALTDHNGLYGSMEFAHQAKSRGIQPITGAEITLEDESHLTLLAETPAGYSNLCRLITAAHRENERNHPGLRRALLRDHAEGLIVLSGCRRGAISQALDRRDRAAAERLAREYRDWFGPSNFYIELQHHSVYGDTGRVRALIALARQIELSPVAVGNVHYHVRARHRLQDVLVAISRNTTLDACHEHRRPNSEFCLAPPQAMERRFGSIPEAITNTLRIAERCQAFDLTLNLGYEFPDFHGEGEADAVLAAVCQQTLQRRYARENSAIRYEAQRRLRTELELVRHHQLSGFFLVHRDLLDLAREVATRVRGENASGLFDRPPGRGRGSSVSSLICYLIGLSPIDPIKAKLGLGRFLNRELASIPDIDLDFDRLIREDLIREVHKHYGNDHVAMVAAYPTYRLRSAVRQIGKALALPEIDVDRLARLSEGGSAATVEEEMHRLPGFEQALESKPWQLLIELAKELAGFPRHLSQHPGGIIISSRPLVELVPVEQSAMAGRMVVQWDKDSVSDARFIKVDFLSLGMLSAIEESLDLIAANNPAPVDLGRIDFNDQAVYDRICSGATIGTFQVESRAQIQMLGRTQPRNLEDLAVQVAIVRPGPLVAGAINPYVANRERLRQNPDATIYYAHPSLIPVLKRTLGVIIFQDQVLRICEVLAGFSTARAEAMRRAMSRRRSKAAMEQFCAEFVAGAAQRGVDKVIAARVFEQVMGFAAYGFPEGHAMSFGLLAYQSVWLSHYYPVEFTASLLNNQPMGFYSKDTLIKDAQHRGIKFEQPEVNASKGLCTVSGKTIRLGLGFIRGLNEQAIKQIIDDREQTGEFQSLTDLLRRVPLPCGSVESLIEAGACDGFGIERRQLLWQLGLFARMHGWMAPHQPGGGSQMHRRQPSIPLPLAGDNVSLPQENNWERLLSDYRLMEFSSNGHPMSLLRPALPKGILSTAQVVQRPDGRPVYMGGLIVTRQRPSTAKGFTFLLIEDERGLLNVVVSPQVYAACRTVMRGEPLIWIAGTVQRRDSTFNIVATGAGSLLDVLRDPDLPQDDPAIVFLHDLRQAAPRAHSWR